MATIMARITRSGTLVGPGTKRKFRPGILGPGIKSSRSQMIEGLNKASAKLGYLTQPASSNAPAEGTICCHFAVGISQRRRSRNGKNRPNAAIPAKR